MPSDNESSHDEKNSNDCVEESPSGGNIGKLQDHESKDENRQSEATSQYPKDKFALPFFLGLGSLPGTWWDSLKNPSATNRLVAIATIVIAIATAIYTYYARKQWKVMSKTLQEIQKQYPLVQQQVGIMHKEMEASFAAVLNFSTTNWYVPNANTIAVSFSNWGHVAATDIHATMVVSVKSSRDGRMIGETHKFVAPIQVLDAPSPNDPDSARSRFRWEQPYRDTTGMVAQGKAALVMNLSVSYNNGFRSVRNNSCYAYAGFMFPLEEGKSYTGYEETVNCSEVDTALGKLRDALLKARQAQRQYKRTRSNKNPN